MNQKSPQTAITGMTPTINEYFRLNGLISIETNKIHVTDPRKKIMRNNEEVLLFIFIKALLRFYCYLTEFIRFYRPGSQKV